MTSWAAHLVVPGTSGRRGGLEGVAAASLGAAATSVTIFLVGALAVQIRSDLLLSLRGLGLAVSVYYLAAAAAAAPAGRLAEWLGGVRTMRVAAAGAGVCLVLVAAVARSMWALAVILAVAGALDAAMQSAANLFLVRRIAAGRRGLAFGVKQAAVPFTALLGGLAVPTLGLTIGWRWAFAGAAGLAVAAVWVIPRPRTTLAERRRDRRQQADVALAPLVVLAIGFGLSMLSITALTTFLVTSAVASGLGKGTAGLLVGLAGAVAVGVRIGMGARADRTVGRHLRVVGGMLVCGAAGYVLLAAGSASRLASLTVLGAVVTYGAGWGWNGVFNMAVSVNHPAAPAKASGITLTGNRVAGIAGPFLFALVVTHTSYTVAWLAAAGAALAAATTMFLGDGMLAASQARLAAAGEPAPADDIKPIT
ncbi:MAG TPA: MFS transporter [Streptosporangiaceae bacterium]|nr:MFS transporter [Streptosporangiaceae bacterium]